MARNGEPGRSRARKSVRAHTGKESAHAPETSSTLREHSSAHAASTGATPPSEPAADADFTTPPPNPDALHAWIEGMLDIHLARTPLIVGHSAPFDYICHAFFEGAHPARAGSVPGPESSAGNPRSEITNASSSSDCIVWANRGGGKTCLGALATLLDLIFKARIQVRILAGSLEQARRMHDHLRSFLLGEKLEPLRARITSRRIVLANGSCVEILAASQTSVRGTRVQKIRCDEVDLFDPDVWDAAQLVTRSMACKGPWGERVRGSVEALSTMHKPYGLMWKLVGAPAARGKRTDYGPREVPVTPGDAPIFANGAPSPEGARVGGPGEGSPAGRGVPLFRWGLLDVLEHCTDEHVCAACPLEPECRGRAKTLIAPGGGGHITVADAVAMKRRVGRQTWDSEMLCLRPSRSSTVYPDFDAGVHVIDGTEGLEFRRFLGGMDFGFRSECVCLLAGQTRDGTLVVLREHCRRGALVHEMVGAFGRWIEEGVCAPPGSGVGSLEWIAVDPAGLSRNDQTGRTNCELLRDQGFSPRWKQARINEGVLAIRARLAPATDVAHPEPSLRELRARRAAGALTSAGPAPRLLVHQGCTRLIECLCCYRYPEDKPECEEPLKDGHDHACDALRYLVQMVDGGARTSVSNYLRGN